MKNGGETLDVSSAAFAFLQYSSAKALYIIKVSQLE
jgi:hypothetical protein